MWFSAHPLQALLASDTRRGCIDAADVTAHTGRRVRVCGVPCASRRVEARTAAGGSVLFTTLADETGLVECVLFPKLYAQLAPAMRGEIVLAEGRVDETLGAMTLVVDRAKACTVRTSGAAPETAPSRNRSEALNAGAGEAGPASRYREGGTAAAARATAAGA
jgi:DNA polymerase III alpha subunit